MTIIAYKKVQFREPDKISESTYIYYKQLLSEDPNVELTNAPLNFIGHFSRTFRNLLWLLAACLLLSLMQACFFNPSFRKPDAISLTILVITLIIGFIALGLLLQVLLEGPSYASFLKDSSRYFDHMKEAIRNSQDYPNFMNGFYSGSKGHFKTSNSPLKKQPLSADRFLTDVFYLIDLYWWMVFLLGAVLFFGRKLF
ncbi:hypothetical protein ACX0G9_04455 [Flavitalea flava]